MRIWNKKLFLEGEILLKFEQTQLKCNGDIFHTRTHEGHW